MSNYLKVSEVFYSIQGENIMGTPSVFLRLQGCTLNCNWCDTTEVWKKGQRYDINHLLMNFEDKGWVDMMKRGAHLVLTGGSPLMQQDGLVSLLKNMEQRYELKPFVEIENECTLIPKHKILPYINIWNNSPKLKNSGMSRNRRYKPDVIRYVSQRNNSWFKFVIQNEGDLEEIQKDFLDNCLIKPSQVVLMPEGSTREELEKKREWLVEVCKENCFKYSDRLQVLIWNKTTGV